MSPKNVPSSTISTSGPPCGSPRSIAACATPSPIQAMMKIVVDIEAVMRSRCGIAIARKNVSGMQAMNTISTCRSCPAVPATSSPSTPIIAASRTGRARSSIT